MIQGPQVFPGTQDSSRFESIESLRRGLAIIFNKHDGLPSSLSSSHDDEKENKSEPTDEDFREFEAMLGGEDASTAPTIPTTTSKVPSSPKKVLIKAPPRKPRAKIIPSRAIVPARAAAAITTAVKSAKVTTTTITIADRELEGIHPLLLQMHPKTLAREAAREAAHQELERGKNLRRCFQYKIGKDTKKRTGNYRR